jgi:hypothetical protein
MNEPIQGQQLFELVARALVSAGASQEVVRSVAINLIVNSIRQSVGRRSEAEARIDELFNAAKTILLEGHYDSVTGNRRSVIPFTQVVQMPFHSENSVIFHGK